MVSRNTHSSHTVHTNIVHTNRVHTFHRYRVHTRANRPVTMASTVTTQRSVVVWMYTWMKERKSEEGID